jgi:hypothetical protein
MLLGAEGGVVSVEDDRLDAALALLLELETALVLLAELLLALELDNKLLLELLAELGGVGSGCVLAIMVLTEDQFPTASPALTP